MHDTATIEAAKLARRTWLVPLVLYCSAHFLVDLYTTALGILQPVLQKLFKLSFTQAGILAGVYVLSGSMMQPLYGYLCDRFRSRLFSALGPAIAAVFLSLLVWGGGFYGLLLMVALGGVGVAAFHPQAASNAIVTITRHRKTAMAVFISCGSLGMAAGPLCFSPLLERLGLQWLALAAIPGVLMTCFLLFALPSVESQQSARGEFDWAPLKTVWKPMTILYLLVMIRSVVQVTFQQFLPLYLTSSRRFTISQAALSLSLFLLSGAIGGFAGGGLADRFGGRLIILISMIASVPFLALFVFGRGVWSMVGLSLGGLILLFTNPVNIVLAQELAPRRAGVVSALMMGFAWGSAGFVFIPLVGLVSDLWSMQVGFACLVLFPLVGFLLALRLPRDIGIQASMSGADD
jgi:FSR family fosmidomycin resistance protein-like MFS transporter